VTAPGRAHVPRAVVVVAGWTVGIMFVGFATFAVLVVVCCAVAVLACRESLDMWNVRWAGRGLPYAGLAAASVACTVYAARESGIYAGWAAVIGAAYVAACIAVRRDHIFVLACLMPMVFILSLSTMRALPQGRELVIITIAAVWTGDIFAFLWGRYSGRKLYMLPKWVNERKSLDAAAIGAIAAAGIFIVAGILFLKNISVGGICLCAVATGIAGQVGDVAESAVKRAAGVVDSGRLLGGQGGMLDAIDGLSFALPFVIAVLSLIHKM